MNQILFLCLVIKRNVKMLMCHMTESDFIEVFRGVIKGRHFTEFGWRIAAEKKETLRIRIISIICGVTNYLFFCTALVINTKPRE